MIKYILPLIATLKLFYKATPSSSSTRFLPFIIVNVTTVNVEDCDALEIAFRSKLSTLHIRGWNMHCSYILLITQLLMWKTQMYQSLQMTADEINVFDESYGFLLLHPAIRFLSRKENGDNYYQKLKKRLKTSRETGNSANGAQLRELTRWRLI
ncbi:hypothetical protein OUZ56_003314 [Daphnia magna]|uniref:Uncharacterized protein n=1 Tax=Daphnia magna TaxID=35525 RepID=A0ABR0A8G5_9CRUS|nr:hypothetical protein OUZ56_003314 [Daphnia magna]